MNEIVNDSHRIIYEFIEKTGNVPRFLYLGTIQRAWAKEYLDYMTEKDEELEGVGELTGLWGCEIVWVERENFMAVGL